MKVGNMLFLTLAFFHREAVVGTGESHAQVTVTLPLAGSASWEKTPGLTSRSVGAQPVPVCSS